MGRMEGCRVLDCERCPALVEARSQIVNGVGPEDADLLVVGEAPGADEDAQGEPFVGRSGKVLTEKLADHGLDRDSIRISNCIRCRPPENRDPLQHELDNCLEYLEREIEIVDPELIMTVGKVPSSHLLSQDVAVTKEAGEFHDRTIGGRSRRILVSPHPAAMFYNRSLEAVLDETLGTAAAALGREAADDQAGLDDFDE